MALPHLKTMQAPDAKVAGRRDAFNASVSLIDSGFACLAVREQPDPKRLSIWRGHPKKPSGVTLDSPPRPTLAEDHPLHLIDRILMQATNEIDGLPRTLDIHPEGPGHGAIRLIRAMVLQVLYSLTSDHQLSEQLRYNLLYRWFVGLYRDDLGWEPSEFAYARADFLQSTSGIALLRAVLGAVRPLALAWPEHFRFDDALLHFWAAPSLTSASKRSSPHEELFEAAGLPSTGAVQDRRFSRAIEIILKRVSDPGLNCDAIASEVGLSRRALYYMFDAYGLTPSVVIRNIRLDRCRKALENPKYRDRKITAIALDFGFSNTCAFWRTFKQRYGVGPRECRMSAIATACTKQFVKSC